MLKKLLSTTFLFLFSLMIFSACNSDDPAPCNCPQNAPWSVPGSDNCYVDPFECEIEEGQECEICS